MKNFMPTLMILLLVSMIGCKRGMSDEDASVHYFGFEIDRITGIHEDEIVEVGCRYSVGTEHFRSLLTRSAAINMSYAPNNVRAVVIIGSDYYYIDIAGNTRFGDKFYTIDRKNFAESLVPHGEC